MHKRVRMSSLAASSSVQYVVSDSHGLNKACKSPPGRDLGRNSTNIASQVIARLAKENQAMANLL